jgi:putative two-component system response regulator
MSAEIRSGTVLIVDAEESADDLYTKLISKGYSCFEANSREKAAERLDSNLIDITILDINIQNFSGIGLLSNMVSQYPNTAVIATSGIISPNVVIQCMKSGAQDYIIKPFNIETIVGSIEEILRKRQIESMLKAYQAGLEGKVSEQAKKIREIFLHSIDALVSALEEKDEYTAGHSRRVYRLSYFIAKQLGLSVEEIDDLCWGALLHDVGKIAIDPRIQNKPGKLTEDEYAQIMKHVQIGPRIVKSIANTNIVNIIKYHHTRFDTNASIFSSENEEVSVGTRIVTLADAFDAMTSDRPYRKSFSLENALAEVKRCAGNQFDPCVVNAFLQLPHDQLMNIINNHDIQKDLI